MIYFQGGEEARSLKELIMMGYRNPNGYFAKTYSDEECIQPQCHSGRRSFLDLYECAVTYFPNTTREELAYILFHECPQMRTLYCNTINKLVFVRDNSGRDMWFQGMTLSGGISADPETKDSTGMSYNIIQQYANNYRE